LTEEEKEIWELDNSRAGELCDTLDKEVRHLLGEPKNSIITPTRDLVDFCWMLEEAYSRDWEYLIVHGCVSFHHHIDWRMFETNRRDGARSPGRMEHLPIAACMALLNAIRGNDHWQLKNYMRKVK